MRLFALLAVVFLTVNIGALSQSPLVVFTYDSFVSFGPAVEIERRFEERTGLDVQFVATGDSRSMLARLLTERASGGTSADVFIGVEVNDLATATEEGAFVSLDEDVVPSLTQINSEVRFDPQNRLLPYEHGFITLVYDAEQVDEADLPGSLEALADPRFRDSLLIQDPRTSSPGLSFLLWTISEFGDPGYLDFWERLLPNVLTIAPGWGEAFSLFIEGEAPFLVSFSTDNAFDRIVNGTDNIRVLLLEGQGYRTIFGAGVVDTSDQPEAATAFVDFLLSEEVQSLLPTTEWMFPANVNAELPEAFAEFAVLPPQPVSININVVSEQLDDWLRAWVSVASR